MCFGLRGGGVRFLPPLCPMKVLCWVPFFLLPDFLALNSNQNMDFTGKLSITCLIQGLGFQCLGCCDLGLRVESGLLGLRVASPTLK